MTEKQKQMKIRVEAFQKEKEAITKELLSDKNSLLPGSGLTWFQIDEPCADILRTFENPSDLEYEVILSSEELTAMCPLTGFPDFYNLEITYSPDKKCIESKSFKFYIGSFREAGMFIETLTNKIANDIMIACNPNYLCVSNTMKARGGVPITVVAERYKKCISRGDSNEQFN